MKICTLLLGCMFALCSLGAYGDLTQPVPVSKIDVKGYQLLVYTDAPGGFGIVSCPAAEYVLMNMRITPNADALFKLVLMVKAIGGLISYSGDCADLTEFRFDRAISE